MAARPALTAQGRVRRVRFGSEWGADLEDNRLSSLCRPTGTHAPSSTNSQRPSMIMRSDLTDTEELTGSNPVRPTSTRTAGQTVRPIQACGPATCTCCASADADDRTHWNVLTSPPHPPTPRRADRPRRRPGQHAGATWLGHPRLKSGRRTCITSHRSVPGAQEHQGSGPGHAPPACPRSTSAEWHRHGSTPLRHPHPTTARSRRHTVGADPSQQAPARHAAR